MGTARPRRAARAGRHLRVAAAARVSQPRPGCRARLVLALVDQRVMLDPRHHRAQPLAELLDLVLRGAAAHRLEAGLARGVFQHPFARETAALDLTEDPLHLGPDVLVDDPGYAQVVAVLDCVRARVAHIGDAALID